MTELIFWLAVSLTIYSYGIYPALLYSLPRRKNRTTGVADLGPVAVLCSVYNEEKIIGRKIDNFYGLDYPGAELYLGLDGCTDQTMAEISRTVRDDRVKVFEFPRGGKVSVINALMKQVHQPYIVMTDANSMFRPDAVARLLARLEDGVGAVCGRLLLLDELGHSGEGIYWHIETLVKKLESSYGSVIGANGAIYLFRRELFEPLPPETINDDFSISMRIYERGYAIVYADDAMAEERLVTSNVEEFWRHVRDAAGHFRALAYHWRLLNPLQGKRFFFYVSHRVIRWLVPFFLIAAFLSNALLLEHPLYRILFIIQCSGYGMVGVVHIFGIRWKPLYVPYYFILVNTAIIFGFFKNMFGLQRTAWESTRR
jgi:cellulose synthase/poly-beta-1,6-N-acetylglucosamine synthase-like glycosyltransferase